MDDEECKHHRAWQTLAKMRPDNFSRGVKRHLGKSKKFLNTAIENKEVTIEDVAKLLRFRSSHPPAPNLNKIEDMRSNIMSNFAKMIGNV
eukprot:3705814-Amphidinium_carterae.1